MSKKTVSGKKKATTSMPSRKCLPSNSPPSKRRRAGTPALPILRMPGDAPSLREGGLDDDDNQSGPAPRPQTLSSSNDQSVQDRLKSIANNDGPREYVTGRVHISGTLLYAASVGDDADPVSSANDQSLPDFHKGIVRGARPVTRKRKAVLPVATVDRLPSASDSVSGANDQMPNDDHCCCVGGTPLSDRDEANVVMSPKPGALQSDHPSISDETEAEVALPPELGAPDVSSLIQLLRDFHSNRQAMIRGEGALKRQIKSIERRLLSQYLRANHPDMDEGEILKRVMALKEFPAELELARQQATQAFTFALQKFSPFKKAVDRQLEKAAKLLPVYKWVESVNGFGATGLGQIIGETGDLSNYDNPAKVWKRMGLGLVNGERQRKCADKDKAIAMGYSPARRSVIFVIGDSLLKHKNEYKKLYDARKAFEIEKANASGKQVVPANKITKKNAATSMSKGHVHRRAQRYVEKRLLRDLWRRWRDQSAGDNRAVVVDPSPLKEAA